LLALVLTGYPYRDLTIDQNAYSLILEGVLFCYSVKYTNTNTNKPERIISRKMRN
jgi:hypothetical protein